MAKLKLKKNKKYWISSLDCYGTVITMQGDIVVLKIDDDTYQTTVDDLSK